VRDVGAGRARAGGARRSLGRLGLVLFGLAVALLFGEVALRIVRPVPEDHLLPFPYRHDLLARIVAGETYVRFDADLGWAPNPGAVRRETGVVHEANGAGIRAAREFPVEPPPGVRRLAAFGDSFTYCDEVELADCWAARLETAWPATEVLNFGGPGYGPDQAWLRYERDGRAYAPCAVLIGYMPENLNRTIARFFPFYEPSTSLVLSKPRFQVRDDRLALLPNPIGSPEQLADPRTVEALLGPGDRWHVPGMFVPGPLDGLMAARLVRTTAYHRHAADPEGGDLSYLRAAAAGPAWAGTGDPEAFDRALTRRYEGRGEGLELTARILTEFARSAERSGSTPIVVVFPRRADVATSREGGPKLYGPLLGRLASAGVATIDLTGPLTEASRRGRTRDLFAPLDHYSPRGNEVAAAHLARTLPPLTARTCGAAE